MIQVNNIGNLGLIEIGLLLFGFKPKESNLQIFTLHIIEKLNVDFFLINYVIMSVLDY